MESHQIALPYLESQKLNHKIIIFKRKNTFGLANEVKNKIEAIGCSLYVVLNVDVLR